MEKKMNYNAVVSSLKDICLRKVAVMLWTRPSIIDSIHMPATEYFVIDDASKLQLHPLLTEQLLHVLLAVQSEMMEWIFLHVEYLHISKIEASKYSILFCWTNSGKIDYQETAKNLIHSKVIDVFQGYKLSCLYCLEDYIRIFWEKLPEENKKEFWKEELLSAEAKPALEFCWPYIIEREESKLNNMLERPFGNPTTFNQYAFEYSANEGNRAATAYFFQKLTNAEREASLLRTVNSVIMHQNENVFVWSKSSYDYRFDTLCYLLSLLSLEQQTEILKAYPLKALRIFLDWRWQDLCLDVAEFICPSLTADEYVSALQSLSRTTKSSQLFQEIFLRGSSDFRKHFVEEECKNRLPFCSLFRNQDFEAIRNIFRAVNSVDRKRILYSKGLLNLFYKSILRGNCGLMKLCLQEANLSEEDKNEFKETFHTFFTAMEEEREVIRFDQSIFFRDEQNRREYIWEQFLRIVHEDDAQTT